MSASAIPSYTNARVHVPTTWEPRTRPADRRRKPTAEQRQEIYRRIWACANKQKEQRA